MGFYEELRDDTAAPLIEEYGQPMTVNEHIAGQLDPITGVHPAGVDVAYPGFGVELEYKMSEINGTQIQRGDKRVLFSPTNVAMIPKTSHTLTVGGLVYAIKDASPLSPGGIAVFWWLQVRR